MSIDLVLHVTILLAVTRGAWAGSFTVLNNCGFTVWPGFLSNAGIAPLETTGYELLSGSIRVIKTPAQWSGRIWGRTGCTFGADGKGSCITGDCGGQLHCDGAGAIRTASLAAFTVNPAGLDLYDASLVDNYYLPMVVLATRGTGAYMAAGCIVDINISCPKELELDDGLSNANNNVLACEGACEAFGSLQYCCIEAKVNHNMSKPSTYSQNLKTSAFTCADAYLAVTFCPLVTMDSQMSSISTPLATSPTANEATSNANGPGRTIIGGSKLSTGPTASAESSDAKLTSTEVLNYFLPVLIIMIFYF